MSLALKKFNPKNWFVGILLTISSLSYSAVAQAQVVFQTQQVTSLNVVQGQPQWGQNAARRLAGAVWQFNPDGTFIFAPADARADLYPIRGTFQTQGNVTTFQASSSSSSSVSSNQAQIVGQIQFVSGRSLASIDWATGSAISSVVNNTGFSASPSSRYQSQLILQQVR